MSPESGYMTPEELVKRYQGKVKLRTLRNWRSMGNGPPFTKIGGTVLYPKKDLENWEAQNTVVCTSEYSAAKGV